MLPAYQKLGLAIHKDVSRRWILLNLPYAPDGRHLILLHHKPRPRPKTPLRIPKFPQKTLQHRTPIPHRRPKTKIIHHLTKHPPQLIHPRHHRLELLPQHPLRAQIAISTSKLFIKRLGKF